MNQPDPQRYVQLSNDEIQQLVQFGFAILDVGGKACIITSSDVVVERAALEEYLRTNYPQRYQEYLRKQGLGK